MVVLALVMVILLGFAGLAVDGSNVYLNSQRMQIAADAAALGGARELASNGNTASVQAEIHDLAVKNDADSASWNYDDAGQGVEVSVERTIPAYFARIFGRDAFTVSAEAEARYETVTEVGNLFPLTLSCTCFQDDETVRVEGIPTPTPTPAPTATPTCTERACLVASPRLLSVNTNESALLNPLLQGMLGVSLNVNVVDWNGLAASNVTVGQLKTALGVGTTSQLLSTPITLGQLFTALHSSLPGGLPGSLSSVIVKMPAGTILLGDILNIDPSVSAYSSIKLNALDLATAAIELFNYKNTVNATVTVPLSVSGVSNNGLTLKVKVITPPVFVCGVVGTTFQSAQIRVGLGVDVNDLTRLTAINLINISITVTKLDLYLEVASGTGMISAINAIAQTVSVSATPSIASLYLGSVTNTRFNQTTPINPATDLTYGTIGQVQVKLLSILGVDVLSTSSDLGIKLSANGAAASTQSLYFTGSGAGIYPETKTATAGARSLNSLLSTLVASLNEPGAIQTNLDLSILGLIHISLSSVLTNVTSMLLGLLNTGGVLNTVLSNVLLNVLDPLLNLLGIGLGEMDVTVIGVVNDCIAAPVATPTPSSGDSSADGHCPFEWLDWNGVATSNTEIAGYMQDVEQSGVWKLHEVIPLGPAVQFSTAVDAKLEAREGTIVRIPLTQPNDDDYAICGFANARLVDHNLSAGWIDLHFVNLLIYGNESNLEASDYGARDIRLVR